MLVEKKLHTILTASFRFVVSIDGQPVGAFTECTLPTIEWEMEQIKEGGLNTSVHQLPGHRKPASITLKHGIGIVDTLLSWCIDTMNEKFKRRNLTVAMHNSMKIPVIIWHIQDAVPVRWSAPQLQADSNTVAIQTLEMACGEVTVEGVG
jgi:phage tail-like protein